MNCRYRFNKTGVLLSSLLACLILFFCKSGIVAGDHNAFSAQSLEAAEKQQLLYLATQFRQRIQANENTIKTLINEKESLENRIKRLSDLGRPVPWEMHQSVGLKQQKIETSLKENERLHFLLQQDKYRALEEWNLDSSANDLFNSSGSMGSGSSSLYGNGYFSGDINAFKRTLAGKIRDSELAEWIHFSSEQRSCTIENVLPILFASGSADIPKEYKDFLKRLALLVKNYDVRILINGYADSDNINNKKYPSNFELGATRAANIVHELVKHGVKPSVFQIGTTGKYRHQAKGMSDKKLLERRADLKIVFISGTETG
ncbi:exported hypothetical protein [Desulfamplus magnetovallimortis]|uniref:OmpA-like domain-containing protein n=1 Tax=Desulfamplus magnetovallimortis TaxID=1246637 RepID=A0A1W1HKE1_9BACT|nr:OmpA family protein [Desulfamplus magnetovallimortis]SLM32987.1 exported hypothetical protein [Desulfamplus magnetovallimortis]